MQQSLAHLLALHLEARGESSRDKDTACRRLGLPHTNHIGHPQLPLCNSFGHRFVGGEGLVGRLAPLRQHVGPKQSLVGQVIHKSTAGRTYEVIRWEHALGLVCSIGAHRHVDGDSIPVEVGAVSPGDEWVHLDGLTFV